MKFIGRHSRLSADRQATKRSYPQMTQIIKRKKIKYLLAKSFVAESFFKKEM
jgi:hypothetical protein